MASEAALREAASIGNTARVAELITQGYVKDVDAPNAGGWTSLHLAAYGGHLATLEELLKAGASVKATDAEGHNAVHFAASCRKEFCPPRVDIVDKLLTFDASQLRSPEEAGGDSAADGTQQADELHSDTRARSPGGTDGGATKQRLKVELMTAADDSGMTPLHVATGRGHTLLVKRMLEHLEGGDGPSEDSSLVHSVLHAKDSKGYTVLHLAAKHRDKETAKLLLDWGVNPAAKCKEGKTALDVSPHDDQESTQLRSLLNEAAEKWDQIKPEKPEGKRKIT